MNEVSAIRGALIPTALPRRVQLPKDHERQPKEQKPPEQKSDPSPGNDGDEPNADGSTHLDLKA